MSPTIRFPLVTLLVSVLLFLAASMLHLNATGDALALVFLGAVVATTLELLLARRVRPPPPTTAGTDEEKNT
jgi:hypothetical protein